MRILIVLLLFALTSVAQQANPPRSRVEKTNQPPTPTSQAQNPETPPQTPPPSPEQATQRPTPERPEQQRPSPPGAEVPTPAQANFRFDMTEHPPVQTHHTISVRGKTLRYTATAGRLPIKDATGKINAEMFFVAYTLDGADPARRPVTFSFNGGPGSASIWLHMGALGPRTVVLQPQGWMPAAPYRLQDNQNTPLDASDIVMIDAIGTGFSRPADMEQARHFWSLRGDIESFGEFIRLYISRYERWASPLYLLGESYGTTRSAGVAGYLADHGINFNGICLLSMVLNFESLEFARTNDVPYPLILPSYTMIAAYHKKLPANLMSDVNKTRQDVSNWALNDYWSALNKGDSLTPQERQATVQKLAEYTGLPANVIDMANMRIDVRTFTSWLLADQRKRVGRLDGRYTSDAPDGPLESGFQDPTSNHTTGPFTMVFNNYIRTELNYKVDMPYYTSAREIGSFSWTWANPQPGQQGGGFEMGYADVATSLRAAMVKDPYVKVLVMEGHYDLATPFLAAQYTMNHLDLTPDLRKNFSYTYFDSGHMVYLDQKAHDKMHNDYVQFVESNLPK